jgi:alpha-beta hydrolase superfamily lysophospholipase
MVYNRSAMRIASDDYRVRVVGDGMADVAAARAAATALPADEGLPSPKAVVGSDTGALLALGFGAATGAADALVLAGLPVRQPPIDVEWNDELALRSACPVHHRALPAGSRAARCTDRADPVVVPVLAVHGSADAISDVTVATTFLSTIPGADGVVIEGGKHEVLNDVTHRTVAALIVQFLERLRLGADLPVIARRVDGTREPVEPEGAAS